MRTFVTGSTGLLGNNLVRTLHQAGHEVWARLGVKLLGATLPPTGLNFTWRMNLPVPCNNRAGSGSSAP